MIEEEDLQLPSGVKGIGMLGTAGKRGGSRNHKDFQCIRPRHTKP